MSRPKKSQTFRAELVTRGGLRPQPDCKRCSVAKFDSPLAVLEFATSAGLTLGCLKCKRVRYWAFEFQAARRLQEPSDPAWFEVLPVQGTPAPGALLVRAGCGRCGQVDGVLFTGDGTHAPFGTCCSSGRLLWQEGSTVAWV